MGFARCWIVISLLVLPMLVVLSVPAIAADRVAGAWREAVRHGVAQYRIRLERVSEAADRAVYRVLTERKVETRELDLNFIRVVRTTPGSLISKGSRVVRYMVGPQPRRCAVCVPHQGHWYDDVRRRWKHNLSWGEGRLVNKGVWRAVDRPLFIQEGKGFLGIQQQRRQTGDVLVTLRPLKGLYLQATRGTRRFQRDVTIKILPGTEDVYWSKAEPALVKLTIPLWR